MPGKRSAVIVIDAVEYKVHPLNINELEEVTSLSSPVGMGLLALRKALERGAPPVSAEEFGLLEPDQDELETAIRAVMKLSGMEAKKDSPPVPPAPPAP